MRPKLSLIIGVALSDRRYTYGEHVRYGDNVCYGGLGTITYTDPYDKIQLSLQRYDNNALPSTLYTYDDTSLTYDADFARYDGLDVREDSGPLLNIDY